MTSDDSSEEPSMVEQAELQALEKQLHQSAHAGKMLLERAEDLERELRETREQCRELEENNELLKQELTEFQESRNCRQRVRTLTELEQVEEDDLKENTVLDKKERTVTEWDLQEVETKWDVRLQDALEHSQELEEECQRLRIACQELREDGRLSKRHPTLRATLHADRQLQNKEVCGPEWELADAQLRISELQVEVEELREKNEELQSKIDVVKLSHQAAVDTGNHLQLQLSNIQARYADLEGSTRELQSMFDQAREECLAHDAHIQELERSFAAKLVRQQDEHEEAFLIECRTHTDKLDELQSGAEELWNMLDEEKQKRASWTFRPSMSAGVRPTPLSATLLPHPSAASRGGLGMDIEDFEMEVPEVGRPIRVTIRPIDQGAALRNFLHMARSERAELQRRYGEDELPLRHAGPHTYPETNAR